MDLSSALPQQIVEALARGSTVLTANQRAARTLRHAYDLHQRAQGHSYWQPPAILAWESWLTNSLASTPAARARLRSLAQPVQELTVWRSIIAADPTSTSLNPVDALAQTAADAWLRLQQYRARPRLTSFPGNTDTHAFASWAAEFDRRCARSQYTTQAQLPETLRAAIDRDHVALPTSLLLVGFDSKTPVQIALLDAIASHGTPVTGLDPTPLASKLALAPASDEYGEVVACANWLRTQLTGPPARRIAIIVPALDTARAEIDRIFRSILAPELNNIAAERSTRRMSSRWASRSPTLHSPPLRSIFWAGSSIHFHSTASPLSCCPLTLQRDQRSLAGVPCPR